MTDKEGKSALAYACYQGHLNVARELIARGAQCDLLDKEGVAAIHWAALEVSVTCTKHMAIGVFLFLILILSYRDM